MTRARGSPGFTLIEVVAVLAILAVAAVFVLPAVGRGTAALRFRAEGGRVAALLRDARQQAVSRRQPARVTLDRARSTVALSIGDAAVPLRQLELSPGLRLHASSGPESLAFSSRGITRSARWVLEGPEGRDLAIEIDGITGRVIVGSRSGS